MATKKKAAMRVVKVAVKPVMKKTAKKGKKGC
jgi:hypothetical protein